MLDFFAPVFSFIIPPVRSILGVNSFWLFCKYVCLFVNFFSVKYFSATSRVRILKFGTKLHSDNLYCVANKQPHIPLFVHFTFSSMKISVIDISATIGASVFNFCVHLKIGKVYCVNENDNPHFAFFFQFFLFFPSVTLIKYIWTFLSNTEVRILKLSTKLHSDELYCVTKNSHILLISLFICSFIFLSN